MEASSKFHFITIVIIWLMTERALAASVSPVATSKATTTSVYRNEMIDRLACPPDNGQHEPVNRVNTSQRLEMLRKAMTLSKVDAYIVTGDDEHQTELISPDKDRRQFVSGFTDSSGTAVVTDKRAVLWTDGRYYLQANLQLDCQWTLMQPGDDKVTAISHWLKSVLSPGDRVAADPKLVRFSHWLQWRNDLAVSDIWLDALPTNLVDDVWNDAKIESSNKPTCSSNSSSSAKPRPAYVHDVAFAGQLWQDKVGAVRKELMTQKVDAVVVTTLDEIAWLLNVRGSDVANSPLVEGYVFLSLDRIVLFIQPEKVTGTIREHLNSDRCQEEPICVEVRAYEAVFKDLAVLAQNVSSVLLPSTYAYSGGVSFAIYETIPADKRRTSPSPLILLKATKNAVEVEGMRNAHLKDAVALCDFISLLQEQVQEGKEQWDELKVVHTLDEYRAQQDLNRGPSFSTIAAFGPNGAVIHYRPSVETNRVIDNSSFLLIDSGGQYLDGTTDVTRTFHFGRATQLQKEIYTRVLMGAIDLATLVFPDSIDDTRIDVIARQHLYSAGLDYLHGTGHGIGSFLNVHESPIQIRIYGKVGHHFEENYFFSDEPGFYQENEYGIRLESILRVIRKTFEHERDSRYLGFEVVSLVPFDPYLIVPELMTHKQLHWLNHYQAMVRIKVGEELKRQNRMRAFYWLMSKTRHITEPCHRSRSGATGSIISTSSLTFQFIATVLVSVQLLAVAPLMS
ncbi:xaa-Pro aminopeptidase 1-like isoform X1 [Daphnia pulicaria]|uniref:xaa-Pro aminopeptidase 1-like isoform X1 n=1 Tax=Daphnia pulicaria TaxID=35523 RepID=UPI001EEB7F4D|nr:xaa-Pro aminopeptidase 1-like isoform X1 [Daphnia pulicaria]